MSRTADRQRAPHDHARCIQRAITTAEKVCASRRVNLTPLRRRVFEIVWRQHERTQDGGPKHRLDTLNAFLGCDRPEDDHGGQFLVCSVCRRVAEIDDTVLSRALREQARTLGFRLESSAIEIKAVCNQCSKVS